MDTRPLTYPAPLEEHPAAPAMETLFPELPAPGYRPVEITATIPGDGSPRVVMSIVTGEKGAALAFDLIVGHVIGIDGFEVTARRA